MSSTLDRSLGTAAAELEHEMGEHMDISPFTHAIGQSWRNMPPEWQNYYKQYALSKVPPGVQNRIAQTGQQLQRLGPAFALPFYNAMGTLMRQPSMLVPGLWSNPPLPQQIAPRPQLPAARPGFQPPQVRTYHQRQYARGFVPGRNRQTGRYREMENELELASHELENGEGFWTKVTPIPGLGNKEGHEILTRSAMSGFPLSTAEQSSLLDGIIRPDRGGSSYWNFPGAALGSFRAANQAAHSLRATEATSTPTALAAIQQKFRALYSRALGSSGRDVALGWLGEAMHLLQDSFSSAHVERAGATGPIRRIRAFFVKFGWPPRSTAPHEHNVPSDDRDNVFVGGALRPEAVAAVNASRDLLAMFLRHYGLPGSPVIPGEVNAFIASYLSM
jgi:hypothetical protein